MPFFAVRFDGYIAHAVRAKIQDIPILSFSVLLNRVEVGSASGRNRAVGVGPGPTMYSTSHVRPLIRGAMGRDWIGGPVELGEHDTITILASGLNVSDESVVDQDSQRLQLKIMETMLSSAVGAVGGAPGAALGAAFGALSDPVATILGWEPSGPCNGEIFHYGTDFTGGQLEVLDYGRVSSGRVLPGAEGAVITKRITGPVPGEACDGPADSTVQFSVLRVPDPISVAYYSGRRKEHLGVSGPGLAMLGEDNTPVGVKALLGLRG